METEFKLPELGENISSGQVVSLMISVGETVEVDQPVMEIETDKALIEVPSPISGKVTAVHLKPGDEAAVGQPVITVESNAAEVAKKDTAVDTVSAPNIAEAPQAPVIDREKKEKDAPEKIPSTPEPAASDGLIPAAPSVRRLARELRINIRDIPGTGPRGRISAKDVKTYAQKHATIDSPPSPESVPPSPALPDFSNWGPVERVAMEGVRRATVRQMTLAWSQIPHVTQFDKADITELEKLRKRYAAKAEAAGGKLTITAILLKVVASALKVFPKFNASLDLNAGEVIHKKYCHIGVAVDTERGLLVPVIRDVDKKNIMELAVELTETGERARARKTKLEEMQGGSFTITNLGGIGGTYFTPIVNWPEVAILGVSRGGQEPVYIEGTFQPRLKLPLQLSYDHRLIDGADGIRFLRWVAEALENPFLLPLEG